MALDTLQTVYVPVNITGAFALLFPTRQAMGTFAGTGADVPSLPPSLAFIGRCVSIPDFSLLGGTLGLSVMTMQFPGTQEN